jgi:hypothetical protein
MEDVSRDKNFLKNDGLKRARLNVKNILPVYDTKALFTLGVVYVFFFDVAHDIQ